MLKLESVTVRYGAVVAVRSVSLEVAEGQVTAIVGANGAGKSSCLRAISGLVPCAEGSVHLDGERIERLPAVRRVALGIGHVLEGHRVFGDQTVESNLQLGALLRLREKEDRKAIAEDMERVFARFPVLKDRRGQRAGTLSGGEQQMLAIAVALMQRPRVLLLDEPSLGLAPKLVDEVMSIISGLRDEGHTILLVEQATHVALRIADFGYVFAMGEVVMADVAAKLKNEISIAEAYLGTSGRKEL